MSTNLKVTLSRSGRGRDDDKKAFRRMMGQFKSGIKELGVLADYARSQVAEQPSEKRRRKLKEAQRRRAREASKSAQRDQ